MKRLPSVLVLSALSLSPAMASAAAEKLLLAEVVVAPTQAEYVAIYNPGADPVDLGKYYLSDSDTYYRVTDGASATASGTSDFIVQFPAGSSIGPGQKEFIAVGGAECFKTACGTSGGFAGFGVYPTFEVPSSTPANVSAAVPDMVSPFTGAIGATHGLTNGGEPIILFYWDGVSSLVTDVDYVYYGGATTMANPAVNKTNVSTYVADTAEDPMKTAARHAPLSVGTATTNTCRIRPYSEGAQILTGGNGINGSDETSEDASMTWTACTVVTPDDNDDDGVPDSADDCPTIPGLPANNGCPIPSTVASSSGSAGSGSAGGGSGGAGGSSGSTGGSSGATNASSSTASSASTSVSSVAAVTSSTSASSSAVASSSASTGSSTASSSASSGSSTASSSASSSSAATNGSGGSTSVTTATGQGGAGGTAGAAGSGGAGGLGGAGVTGSGGLGGGTGGSGLGGAGKSAASSSSTGGGQGGGGGDATKTTTPDVAPGGGCSCSVAGDEGDASLAYGLGALAFAGVVIRRRRAGSFGPASLRALRK